MLSPPTAAPANQLFLSGTDTDVGKTTVAAALCAAWGLSYWKPIQAGLQPQIDGETDSEAVARRAGVRVWPEAHRLPAPKSPHRAAAELGLRIDPAALRLPTEGPLLVEGAGGFSVPLAAPRAGEPWVMQAELPRRFGLPVLIVARSGLGTLHHSGSTVAAVRAAGLRVLGLILVGPPHPENEADLPALTGAPLLGRLPLLERLDDDFDVLVSIVRGWRRP